MSKLLSIFIVTLFVSSLIYFEPSLNNENITDSVFPNEPILPDNDNESDENINDEDDSGTTPIKKLEIPGDYKSFAFFSGGGTEQGLELIADPEGEEQIYWGDSRENVIVWETYDDIKDDAYLAKELYWRALSTASHTWPTQANVWFHMHEQNYPDEPSKMFSPVFSEDWYISGRVHYLTYLETSTFSESITIGVRLSVHLFNPADQSTSLITSTTFTVPISYAMTQRTFSSDIASPVLIPAGYRLKYDIELRFSSIPTTGSVLMFTGYPVGGGGSMTWNIVDGIYSNSYTLLNRTRMSGVQLYMRKDVYPDIQIFNAVNETVYSSARDITIDVTDGSTSSFRWNGNPVWTPFDNDTLTSLPLVHGWNTLEVKASDPIYNNTIVELYQFGYDESPVNVVLDNAINNSVIAGDYDLQFSVYNITSAKYRWDGSGPQIDFNSPYNITADNFEGLHDLRIITTDFYTEESYYYKFTFDSTAPTMILQSPSNNTLQAPRKSINIDVNDSSGVDVVTYHWDADAEALLNLIGGITYRTFLPSAGGWHDLYVTANDTHGNQVTSYYTFFTDPTILNVELRYMIDDSYFVGGNDVEVTITSSNDTIKYQWDNDVFWKDKLDAVWDGTYLKLTNVEGLPSTLGVHILKIRTGDLSHVEHIFTFKFTVDQQAPEYDISVFNYSNLRYLGSEALTFTVTDNYTLSAEILMDISVDGGFNQSLLFPFMLPLFSFFDGNHSIVIYVWDVAGNVNVTTIYVIVDNTAPYIDYLITELVNYIHVDGNRYVPADALVDVTLTDADSTLFSYYSINGTAFLPFISDFNLGFLEGFLEVTVRANDSLGNQFDLLFSLILDNSPPTLNLIFPFNYISEINDLTPLQFNTQDLSDKTIDSVEYEWDIFPGFTANAYPETDGDFEFKLLLFIQDAYAPGSTAQLTFYLEDIVGNIAITKYNFTVDKTKPIDSFYIFNETILDYEHISQFYYVQGNTEIIYDNTENDDVLKLEYYWDGNTSEGAVIVLLNGTNLFPWFINVPTIDGEHNLTIKLYDNTGEDQYPNIRTETYFLKVDDITINYITPTDFSNNYHTTILYEESFNFRINVTDTLDGQPLDNVNISYNYDSTYNLSFEIVQIDNITYDFTITAYNVTNGLETEIEFYISQYADHKDMIVIHLRVDKREGNLLVLQGGYDSLYYDSITNLTLQLNDHLNISAQEILSITVNGTEVSFLYFSENKTASISLYIPDFIDKQGNYTFEIYVESSEYFDTMIDSSIITIDVKPMLVLLDVWVLNSTILEGNPVSIMANLTLTDGTPVAFVEIYFIIYIYLKTSPELPSTVVRLSFEDSDYNDTQHADTGSNGLAFLSYTLNSNISSIKIEAGFLGDDTRDQTQFTFDGIVITYPPPEAEELPVWLLALIIGGSILIAGIISFIIYKATRPKPFEELMKKITDEEIVLNYSILSPGIMLSIFDQRKGPIPLVTDHSLSVGRYLGRMQIGIENFLLKIADQAYSSLGFEEHTNERRVGSIVLPSEKMIGFLQGIQLKNPQSRGGFENLSLIVLADREYGNLLLNYQEYLYPKIDELEVALKGKDTLKKVEELMKEIRKISVIIVLAAQKAEKAQENGNNS